MDKKEYDARKGFKAIQKYCKSRSCTPKDCIFAYEVAVGYFKGDYDCIFEKSPIRYILPDEKEGGAENG